VQVPAFRASRVWGWPPSVIDRETLISNAVRTGLTHPKQAGELVLVPNQRVCDRLFARGFRDDGAPVRVAPAVAVLSQWVARTAARLDLLVGVPTPASASPLALQIAWHDAVAAGGGPRDPARRQILARRARAAERELRHWFPEPDSAWLDSEFRTWRNAVCRHLAAQDLAAPEDWLERLAARLRSGPPPPGVLPRQVRLHGFVELTSLERSLLDALRARDVRVEVEVAPRAKHESCLPRAFDDPQTELRAAAAWAREQYRQGRRHIGVVINGLDGLAAEVRAVFDRAVDRVFDGAWSTGATGDGARVDAGVADAGGERPTWHLPGGGLLAGQAVIADALLLLRTALLRRGEPLPFPHFSRLLLSPHVQAADTERHARAVFERQLRRDGYYRRSLHDLANRLRHLPLAEELPGLGALLAEPPRLDPAADPAAAFLDCLSAWGWPGPFAAGPRVAGHLSRFATRVEELAGSGAGSGLQALQWLEAACGETPVTERGGPLSPIQVLSPEDAFGERFEAAWVANVHADNWPGRPQANPYLPASAGDHMPRAGPDGALEYARRLHAGMAALADSVVFSWARQGGDAPRLPSPLVAGGAEAAAGPAPAAHVLAPWPEVAVAEFSTAGYAGQPWLEAVDDAAGLPLAAAPEARIPGGAGMVRDQSACPLAAYLRYRLNAQFESMPGPFADAAYRGQLMHAALDSLYRERVGRPGLPAAAGIGDAVDRALAGAGASQRLSAAGYAAERGRLCRLLEEWLAFERGRAGFSIEAVEWRHAFDYRGFTLTGQIDRADRLPDGRLLLIDYKSSKVAAGAWGRARIAQPQLPLYAVLLERAGPRRVGGLALAAVRAGECGFSGIVDHPDAACDKLYALELGKAGLARRFSDWPAVRAHFEQGIAGLLDEIIAGQADNTPHEPAVLAWAGLEAVLRHAEGADWLNAHGTVLAGADDD
jgi:ATP-dependent helicase/nuclease subunit B